MAGLITRRLAGSVSSENPDQQRDWKLVLDMGKQSDSGSSVQGQRMSILTLRRRVRGLMAVGEGRHGLCAGRAICLVRPDLSDLGAVARSSGQGAARGDGRRPRWPDYLLW